jgi:RNA exonuclease NGL2
MVGNKLTTKQLEEIEASRVVHSSIDPSIESISSAPRGDEEGEAATRDPDRVITNARKAKNEDGLLSDEEFCSAFNAYGPLRSAYDEGQGSVLSEHDNVLGSRIGDIAPGQKGFYEPMWTSYTHYWKTTLGSYCYYIYLLDARLNLIN